MHCDLGMKLGYWFWNPQLAETFSWSLEDLTNIKSRYKLRSIWFWQIGDFGLSRVMETDTYNASTTTSFPVRWTAPETLQSGKISRLDFFHLIWPSSASDVWSFGVVLWEIAEGKRPYPDLSNSEVINAVCDHGVRLPKPQRVEIPDELYKLMLRCWDSEPEKRPSFNDIYSELCKLETQYFSQKVEHTEIALEVENNNARKSTHYNNYHNSRISKDIYN